VSLLHRQPLEDGTLDQCMRLGAIPTAWSPFGGGAIFVSKSDKPAIQRITDAAQPLQEKYNAAFDQLLLAWLLKHPSGIIPVLGTTKIDRIKKAKEALSIQLSHEDWYIMLEAAVGEQVP